METRSYRGSSASLWMDIIEGSAVSKFCACAAHCPLLRKAVMKMFEVRFGYASSATTFLVGLVLGYARIKYLTGARIR